MFGSEWRQRAEDAEFKVMVLEAFIEAGNRRGENMRILITEMIDELVADLAAHRELNDTDNTIKRLKEIRNVAEGQRSSVVDCTEQLAFPFVTTFTNRNGGGRGQTGGGGGAGQSGGATT